MCIKCVCPNQHMCIRQLTSAAAVIIHPAEVSLKTSGIWIINLVWSVDSVLTKDIITLPKCCPLLVVSSALLSDVVHATVHRGH